MRALIEPQLTPEEEELARKKAILAELEAQLADRELERASLLAELVHFEKRYLQIVGKRYAILDDLKARIAEARAANRPDHPDARDAARQARAKAEESARAAGDAPPDSATALTEPSPAPRQSDTLRKLYRQAAKLIHPDQTLDGSEKERRHHLMADLNAAYARGDEARIREILRDWHASPESVQGDGTAAELIRVIRTIAQIEKRLKALAAELDQIKSGELFKLKQAVEEAAATGRDLLHDLAAQLDRDITAASEELERTRKEKR